MSTAAGLPVTGTTLVGSLHGVSGGRMAATVTTLAAEHSPADTPDRVDPAPMSAAARLVVATGWLITSSTAILSS